MLKRLPRCRSTGFRTPRVQAANPSSFPKLGERLKDKVSRSRKRADSVKMSRIALTLGGVVAGVLITWFLGLPALAQEHAGGRHARATGAAPPPPTTAVRPASSSPTSATPRRQLHRRHVRLDAALRRPRRLRARDGLRVRDLQAAQERAGPQVDARDQRADLRDLQDVPRHADQVHPDPRGSSSARSSSTTSASRSTTSPKARRCRSSSSWSSASSASPAPAPSPGSASA